MTKKPRIFLFKKKERKKKEREKNLDRQEKSFPSVPALTLINSHLNEN